MVKFNPTFDETVLRAVEKWPNVPNCFGWLHLDQRGNWRIKNELITHARAAAFLARHYAEDAHGRWYVQNGPQRVFCSLAYTPLILRLNPDDCFITHTHHRCKSVERIVLDDRGNILLLTDLGIGLVDDRDLVRLTSRAESPHDDNEWLDFDKVWTKNAQNEKIIVTLGKHACDVQTEFADDIPSKFGFQLDPQPLPAEQVSN